jgi:arylsulfatase A-like enzyme
MSYPTFTPRHIIFVICDDLAFGDLSCHGNPHCQTLNLDHIHNQSRRMTGYRSGPLCTPARACLMTGRNHLRTGAFDTYIGRSTLHPDEITLAQLLQQSGYHTGLFGKWHLGDVYPARPMDKGFDEAFWHGGGGIGQQGDVLGNSYFNPVFNHNGKPQQTHGYCTDVIFDQAIDWISDHARQQTFTYIAPNCPHTPLQVPESWIEPFRQKGINETHARIYAMVKNIDDAMGRLMQRLDELELTENTMLVFTSDHGPCGSASHEGQHRFNAGLRGIKGSMYEGGLHVPCFIRWPQAFDADFGRPLRV